MTSTRPCMRTTAVGGRTRWRLLLVMPVLLLGVTLLSACNPSTNATIEQTTFTVPSKQFREAFAVCPSGSRALGGGVVQRGSAISLEVQASGPLDSTGVTANTVDGDVAAQW